MRMFWMTVLLGSCVDPAPPTDMTSTFPELYADHLFGRPSKNTGLDAEQCQPTCDGCPGGFAPDYGADDVTALRAWTLIDIPALLADDPYEADPAPVPSTDGACAVVVDDEAGRTYHLEHFPSEADAIAAGALPTHGGTCGQCSSLQDLSVYIDVEDLTDEARRCGLRTIGQGSQALQDCLQDLGFSEPCAQIWVFNSKHTQAECLGPCFSRTDAPHHEEDGALNACLQCDEDVSGDVFKAVAGRTRRNSGIPTALCRPCGSIWPFVHAYP